MPKEKEDGIFLGVVAFTYNIPTEGKGQARDCIKCPVCDKRIIGFGLHVYGYVVNPAVHEKEVAAWRMGASGEESIFFEQDKELLSRTNMPQAIKIDFYCHDFLCFAVFLRNKYIVHPSVLPYDEDDSEKFRAIEGSEPLVKILDPSAKTK